MNQPEKERVLVTEDKPLEGLCTDYSPRDNKSREILESLVEDINR